MMIHDDDDDDDDDDDEDEDDDDDDGEDDADDGEGDAGDAGGGSGGDPKRNRTTPTSKSCWRYRMTHQAMGDRGKTKTLLSKYYSSTMFDDGFTLVSPGLTIVFIWLYGFMHMDLLCSATLRFNLPWVLRCQVRGINAPATGQFSVMGCQKPSTPFD